MFSRRGSRSARRLLRRAERADAKTQELAIRRSAKRTKVWRVKIEILFLSPVANLSGLFGKLVMKSSDGRPGRRTPFIWQRNWMEKSAEY